jgi:hypothetical protein
MADTGEKQAQAAADEKALKIFQQQWEIYSKFLEHDYLDNGKACARLRAFLEREVARPFAFLDLACGDASNVVKALQGTPVSAYRGVDLSAPALRLAKKNLAALPSPVELDEADFAAAMRRPAGPADIVWISLSLHHLDTEGKRALMREVRAGMADAGAFLIYEPTRNDGESRAAYLDRFEEIGRRAWTALSAQEFIEAMQHVRTCDLPETVSQWHALGAEAGFTRVAELYSSGDDLFRLFCYRP